MAFSVDYELKNKVIHDEKKKKRDGNIENLYTHNRIKIEDKQC